MARKLFVISAILIVITIIVCIIISVVSLINTKPVVFRPTVTYSAETNNIIEAPKTPIRTGDSSDIPVITSLLNHERMLMAGSIIVVLIFALLFYGSKRSKS